MSINNLILNLSRFAIKNKDQDIGIVGYEIPFNRYFYQYQPPRDRAEIMRLLQGMHLL